MTEPFEVDSWRFMPPRLARLLEARAESELAAESIPFLPLSVPLAQARVALLSTAGISCPPDPPFDMDGERANPMWGDPSWRRIPASTTAADVEVNHLHIDTGYIKRDLSVALPLARLAELAAAGEVGSVAPSHYSVMGFQLDGTAQVRDSAPAIAAAMKEEGVTAAVLAPV
jgi:D-proline reductase (dithiol) PrdB